MSGDDHNYSYIGGSESSNEAGYYDIGRERGSPYLASKSEISALKTLSGKPYFSIFCVLYFIFFFSKK